MRKIVLSTCFCIIAVTAFAQLSITGNHQLIGKKIGNDSITIILFDSITLNTIIDYKGTNVRFKKYNDPISITTLFPPEDATGYTIEEDEKSIDTIFVIDYKNYHPHFTSFEPENNPNSQCTEFKLLLGKVVPELSYRTVNGTRYTLPRDFTVKYQTLSWNETSASWTTIDAIQAVILPANNIIVPAPLCNTTFTLIGDQYAADLGLRPDSIKSAVYSAVAVECHITSIVTTRDATNEAEGPTLPGNQKGSAPLDIQFLSNANKPESATYDWKIFKDKNLQPLITRTDKDHRYTFTEKGDYKVKLVTGNSNKCSFTDSITITISESALKIPNVFTPNGDGFNDEFRVAYKSLLNFQAWVYNRWGRKVFYWTDPTKGWDGKINGKEATAGPYFYVIKAVGSDGFKYKEAGDINLLR